MTLFLILVCVVLLLLTGVPIFAGLGLTALALIYIEAGSFDGLGEILFGKLSNYLLVSVPLFAFMAQVMIRAKVVDDLYAMVHALVRHFAGGLGVATIGACTIFAAISGSSAATALTIGSTSIPQMLRYGYERGAAYGAVAAGGTLGILIPPSGPAILYALVSDASIGALFIAGVIPGLMIALAFAVFHMAATARQPDAQRMAPASWGERLVAVRRAFWALTLPPVVLGGIYAGVFTATEAAGVGAVMAILIAVFAYRNVGVMDLLLAARDAVKLSAMIFMIIAAAVSFGHVLAIMGLPRALVTAVSELGLGPIEFILVVMAIVFILGMFLDTIAIILLTTPVVLPVLNTFDVDLVWYGILLMINLELALITPPVGMNLFVIKGITGAPISVIVRGSAPYFVVLFCGLILVLLFPQLATYLPSTMKLG